MTDTLEEVDLEALFAHEDSLRCESDVAKNGHQCTVRATYMVYNGAKCDAYPMHMRMLWCDGRYMMHLSDMGEGRFCPCGQPISHWTVEPL